MINTYSLSKGAEYGSYYDAISGSCYSNALSIEFGYLVRDVYLPLLPMERECKKVYEAYQFLIAEEKLEDSEFHPFGFWKAEDVYPRVGFGACIYIPSLFPDMREAAGGLNPEEDLLTKGKESIFAANIEKKHSSDVSVINGEYPELGVYGKLNFLPMIIPTSIAMQFKSKIPMGTKFIIGFKGGRSHVNSPDILAVYESPDYNDAFTAEHPYYDAMDIEIEDLADKILEHLETIENEENKRKGEKEEFLKKLEEFAV